MRKLWIIILAVFMLLSLIGCTDEGQIDNTLAFYYRNPAFSYDAQCSPLIAEQRDSTAFTSLEETLAAYLAGPVSENLKSPFPADLKLINIVREGDNLQLTLSDEIGNLTGLDLTFACCCIAKTCMELTDAVNIVISAETALLGGEKSITMNESNMNLLDSTQQPRSQ